MKILENNYKPPFIKKRCEYCNSLVELDINKDLCSTYNMKIATGLKNEYWCCPCCEHRNIIYKFCRQ